MIILNKKFKEFFQKRFSLNYKTKKTKKAKMKILNKTQIMSQMIKIKMTKNQKQKMRQEGKITQQSLMIGQKNIKIILKKEIKKILHPILKNNHKNKMKKLNKFRARRCTKQQQRKKEEEVIIFKRIAKI